uniref:protein-histidine N-methyltransferase n=1 Tax=Phallusia mammillata TaxID=59560 RepID=A0A6F9DSL3_9ASCI|nr:histone-lysine N-methyltransferase setd3 [Phallusia mammillata]
MGKKSRAKQSGKPTGAAIRAKKELLKMATELFKLGVTCPSRQDEWDYYLKLYNAVQEFSRRQSTACKGITPSVDRESAVDGFETWLKESGVSWDKLKLHYFGGELGFGLVAKEDINMKSLLMSIPRTLMITYEEATKSYLDEVIAGNEVLSVMPNVCLALFIHCERCIPNSKYKPFIDIIPSKFNTTLYFTPEEMKHLKGSPSLSTAINQYKSIVRQFALLYQVFHSNHQKSDIAKIPLEAREAFTFDAYRWSVSAVTTRQNKIPTTLLTAYNSDNDDDELLSTIALIPLWDMFNHSNGPLSTTYNVGGKTIDCFAMCDFKSGEEVTICYGGRPNSELLIHNGFVVTENPFDKVKINLGVSPKDPLYKKRTKLLQRLGVVVNGQFPICAMDSNFPTSPDLLAFLRVFHMEEDGLDEWLEKDTKELPALREVYLTGPLVFKADPKMWLYLENRVSLLLMGLNKSLDGELDSMLEDKSLSTHAKLALQLRGEEKRVLTACMEFCKQFRLSLISEKPIESFVNGSSSESADVKESFVRNKVLEKLIKKSQTDEPNDNTESVQNEDNEIIQKLSAVDIETTDSINTTSDNAVVT